MSEETSGGRSRRTNLKKQNKLALFEKLKTGRNKYEVGELDNVYDEVDEREYSKKVLARQDDDWIVDDGGCGYVEDGREIFDDDLDEESISKSKTAKTGRKRPRDVGPDEKKGNVGKMLMSMQPKKKKEAVKIDEDDVLGDIIGQLGDSSQSSKHPAVAPRQKEFSAKEYLSSLAASKPGPKSLPLPKPNPEDEVLKPISINSNRVRFNESVETPLEKKLKLHEEPALDLKHTNQSENVSKENEKSNDNSELLVIKQEPLDLDEISQGFSDTFCQAFDDADVQMIEQAPAQAPIIEIPEVKEELSNPSDPSKSFDDFGEDWKVADPEPDPGAANFPIEKKDLPLDPKNVMKFYYIDAHEEISQPGVVYLFGKVWHPKSLGFVSCCVVVRNIPRLVFLLPRQKRVDLATGAQTNDSVSLTDVGDEFSKVADKFKIRVYGCRRASKKFAFGNEEIPVESEYLEVSYSPKFRALPPDLQGETFSKVFGCRTSFLELFFLEKGIKGPSWLDIILPSPNAAPCSWCKIEATCSEPEKHILLTKGPDLAPPPIVLMTIVPQAAYNIAKKQTEVVAVSCLVNNAYPLDKPPPTKLFNQHFCLLTKPSDGTWPFDIRDVALNFKKTTVTRVESERALLNCFLAKLLNIDADIIVGHDLSGFGIDLLLTRIAYRKVDHWSRLGRLRRSAIPSNKIKSQLEKLAVTGRLLCDIKISAKELIRSRSYDLNTLCQNVLHFPENKRPETNDEDFKYAYSSSTVLFEMLWNLMADASYILRIFAELNVLPLALQITNIAGNLMSRTLMGGRSERNEFLLLHAFHAKGYILPDKEYKKKDQLEDDVDVGGMPAQKSGRKKPSYAGGLVLEPKVGFYDDLILLMDFNSLYPSIIQEYNICFSTVQLNRIKMDDTFLDEYAKFLPDSSAEKGILPTEIRKLVESRKDVKKLLKAPHLSPELKMQYDIRQMALKLTANSMYGCLGFTYSRFFAKPLAAMITAKGREILMNTKRLVESYGYDVIYGDTDSIMINTKVKDFEQVYTIGRRIKGEVNKFYKQVELDIDGVFKYMLLLRKKKYAAVSMTKSPTGEVFEKQEMKGIDIVRRDWCQLAGEAGKFILKQILSNNSCDDKIENIHGYLETIRQDLEIGKVPFTLLEVTKQLTKAPEDYAESKSLPHVQVALRMNRNGTKRIKQGDTVSYITCTDGTMNPATQRSYHPDEIKNNPNLKVDIEYYLSQQIHPVIARLCDPIEGIDAASIARCLGLDPTKYKRNVRENNTELDEEAGLFGRDDAERFKDCVKFSFKCENSSCGKENILEHPMRKLDNGIKELVLERCANTECKLRPLDYLPSIQNQLHLRVRLTIQDFNKGILVCEDPLCSFETTYLNPMFDGPYPVCLKCHRNQMRLEVTPSQLHNQLVYYSSIFDLSKVTSNVAKFDPETVQGFKKVHDQMERVLSVNKYTIVDLASIFSQLSLPKKTLKPHPLTTLLKTSF